jgi:mono/diheme cytochrome c family protein
MSDGGTTRRSTTARLSRILLAVGGAAAATLACSSGRPPPETVVTLPEAQMTEQLRADYDVFAQRCSKCHSLAKPLNSSVDEDEFWVRYVAKMRRQPASGISERDAAPILRFLHVLVERAKAQHAEKAK